MKSFILFFAVIAISVAHGAPVVKEVLELDRIQPYSPMAFHSERLWTATSQTEGDKTVYDLRLFGADGTPLAGPKRVPHSIEHIYPFGANRVLIVGKSSWPWKTHYTVATAAAETLTLNTTTFPEGIQTEQFGGDPSRMFFNNPGDREVFQWNGKSEPLKHEISGPGQLVLMSDFLFVLERRSFSLGDEDIYRIDLKSGQGKRVFSENRQGLTNLLPLPSRGLLAASEGLADQILLIDAATNAVKATVKVPGGTPRGLAQLGHCLVVGSDVSKKVSFFDLRRPAPELVEEWDLSTTAKPLFNIFSLAADPGTGTVFVRAKDICSSCTVSRNRVLLAADGGAIAKACAN